MITLNEVFDHYNSLDPHKEISKNTPDSLIMSVNYSQFKAICNITDSKNCEFDVRMADFKRMVFLIFDQIAEIIGNEHAIIRLGKKENYLEVYDNMFRNLDEDKITRLEELFKKHKLDEKGFECLVITFIMPVKEGQSVGDENLCMMMKHVPETENKNDFFGYIL